MGITTKIAWAQATWNPWYGCHATSEACRNCYAMAEMKRYGITPTIAHRAKEFDAPTKWTKKLPAGSIIFACSWSDWCLAEADLWRPDAWAIIRALPQYTFALLTKRADRIHKCLPPDWGAGYPNVWLGVTAETQDTLNARMWKASTALCSRFFVSFEPLLGPVDISSWHDKIDWAIIGGETGPHARPTHASWIRDLIYQCKESDIKVFFKGWGKYVPNDQLPDSLPPSWIKHDHFMRAGLAGNGLYPQYTGTWTNAEHHAGDVIDGMTFHEVPTTERD